MAGPIEWSRFGERVDGQAFYAEFLRAEKSRPVVKGREGIAELVLSELRAVLGHNERWMPDEEQGFFGLGMDSLTSLELRNRLEKALGLKLAATVLFDQPSPERLTEYLTGLVEPAEKAAETSELDGLDARELAELLEAKLSSMDSGI